MHHHIGARRGSVARQSSRIAVWAAISVVAISATAAASLIPPPPQKPTGADLARQTATLFAGDPGSAAGDANADGRATAADVCRTLAGTRSPIQPGPYGIGFRHITFTKQSVTQPDVQRTLLTSIWYPADPAFDLLGPPRFLVEIQQTGHYAFSDLCVTSAECGTPDTLTQPEAHWSVLRYAVPFLLQYVAEDHRLAPFLAPEATPPGSSSPPTRAKGLKENKVSYPS